MEVRHDTRYLAANVRTFFSRRILHLLAVSPTQIHAWFLFVIIIYKRKKGKFYTFHRILLCPQVIVEKFLSMTDMTGFELIISGYVKDILWKAEKWCVPVVYVV